MIAKEVILKNGEPIVNHKTGQTKSELLANLKRPGPGRKPDTPEQRIERRAVKELIKEYQEGLTDALSKIKPVLIVKALTGDVAAIKEIHEVVGSHAPRKTELSGEIKLPTPLLGGITKDE